tara:strand:+ start:583 stop:900 length:318 start_codon:yes stop_codon:yes gene_type:complete
MRVTAWPVGKKHPDMGIGLNIPTRERGKYFDRSWEKVYIDLDGEVEEFKIRAGFWHTCNEIADNPSKALRKWFLGHGQPIPWPYGKAPAFELEPLGGGHFKLRYI